MTALLIALAAAIAVSIARAMYLDAKESRELSKLMNDRIAYRMMQQKENYEP